MKNDNVTGVVLAGGMSRRLGRNKAIEIIDGQPMISRIIKNLQKITSRVIVVVNDIERAQLLPIPDNVSTVTDIFNDKGSLGGIYTGLISSDTEWAMMVACDMPFINLDLMRYMISKTNHNDVVVPVTDGRPETMHALYSQRCAEHIERKISQEDLKITRFFQDVRVHYVEDNELTRLDPSGNSFFNVNTESDLLKAREFINQRSIDRKKDDSHACS